MGASAADVPSVAINARTSPLPLAARRTLLAAMQAGSTDEGSLADAPAAPVAPSRPPLSQGAPLAAPDLPAAAAAADHAPVLLSPVAASAPAGRATAAPQAGTPTADQDLAAPAPFVVRRRANRAGTISTVHRPGRAGLAAGTLPRAGVTVPGIGERRPVDVDPAAGGAGLVAGGDAVRPAGGVTRSALFQPAIGSADAAGATTGSSGSVGSPAVRVGHDAVRPAGGATRSALFQPAIGSVDAAGATTGSSGSVGSRTIHPDTATTAPAAPGTGNRPTPSGAGIRSDTTGERRSLRLPAALATAEAAPATVGRRVESFVVRRAGSRRTADVAEAPAAPVAPMPLLPAPVAGTDARTVAMQERFVETLAASSGAAPRPAATPPPGVPTAALPARFRPLTTAVVARKVRIANGPASRAALRAVGRPAATLGNVVHLASAPDDSAATTELLAHELVHAATAPARPRFFAEPGHDAEERHANEIGRIARSARPDAQPAPVVRRVASAPVVPRVVQRVEAPTPAPTTAPAAPPSPQQAEPVIRRSPSGAAPVVRRVLGEPGKGGEEPTSEELNRLEDLILLLERRILNEMERRGGLARGGW